MQKNHIFIGYDEREKDPYNVCVQSLKDSSQDPDRIVVHPIFHRDLRSKNFFDRPWIITPEGTYEDQRDGRPFSVQFSHSRFLTPFLALQENIKDVVMFVDCDFLFQKDVNELFDEARAQKDKYPVQVVKHNYNPQNAVKMDGSIQQKYNKKLWSALMLFDTTSEEISSLTPFNVSHAPGSDLHSFAWMTDEEKIGEINPLWHFVANHSEITTGKSGDEAYAIHYTEGGPWFDKYSDCPYAKNWYRAFYKHIQQGVPR